MRDCSSESACSLPAETCASLFPYFWVVATLNKLKKKHRITLALTSVLLLLGRYGCCWTIRLEDTECILDSGSPCTSLMRTRVVCERYIITLTVQTFLNLSETRKYGLSQICKCQIGHE